jgi:hypothetical protein
MRNIKRRFSICIVVVVFGIFSCTSVENAATPVITLSPSSTPEIHQQLPTRTPTSTPYPTPVPISSEQILQAYFHLGEGNTCELPCFLGIVPGKTIWTDTTKLFAPYITSVLDGIADKNNIMMPRVINLSLPELELQMKFYLSLETEKILFIRTSNQPPSQSF